MPEAKKAERYKSLVGLYYSLRNYPKAIDFGNRALKVSRDPEIQVAVAQAYYQSGNNKEAVRVMNELLASIERSGQVPKEQQLLLVQAACQKAGDNACVAKVFEKLVVVLPEARLLAEPAVVASQARHRRHAEAQCHAPLDRT